MLVLYQLSVELRPQAFNGRTIPYQRLEHVCCCTPLAVELVQKYAVNCYAGNNGPQAQCCTHPPAHVHNKPAVLIKVKHVDDVYAGSSQKESRMGSRNRTMRNASLPESLFPFEPERMRSSAKIDRSGASVSMAG